MQKFLIFLFLAFIIQPGRATVVHGNNKDYVNKEIKFYRYSDPITLNKEFVFLIEFDDEGNFKADVTVEKTEFVFCEFGIFKGLLFLEADKEIELLFPPFRERSFADQKNPFFEPVSFWLETQNKDQLTDKISKFDQKFNELTDRFFNYLYFKQSREIFDSVVAVLNKEFPNDISEVFNTHKELKIKVLESDVFRLKAESVSGIVSTIPEENWNFQAFVEFFGKEFSSQLSIEAKSIQGVALRNAVGNSDINYLMDFAQNKYDLKEKAVALVVLKMLHDGFYSGEFSKETILKMLHSSQLRENKNVTIRNITKSTIDKLEFLMPGSKAPVICLKEIDGNRACSDQNHDKYKYLFFVDTEMIVCREHLKYLAKIEEKFKDYLEVIVVLRETDLIEMKIFLDKQQIPGLKLIDEEGIVSNEYRIQSFPIAILLNKEHKVVFEHTKSPLDGFEQQFGPYLQKERFMQQRVQSQ